LAIRAQHHVAVWAPFAAVEDENDRPMLELASERHLASKLVAQREVGSGLTDLRRARGVIHRRLVGDDAAKSLQHLRRSLLCQPSVELISLLCERWSRRHLSAFL